VRYLVVKASGKKIYAEAVDKTRIMGADGQRD